MPSRRPPRDPLDPSRLTGRTTPGTGKPWTVTPDMWAEILTAYNRVRNLDHVARAVGLERHELDYYLAQNPDQHEALKKSRSAHIIAERCRWREDQVQKLREQDSELSAEYTGRIAEYLVSGFTYAHLGLLYALINFRGVGDSLPREQRVLLSVYGYLTGGVDLTLLEPYQIDALIVQLKKARLAGPRTDDGVPEPKGATLVCPTCGADRRDWMSGHRDPDGAAEASEVA